MSKYLYLIRGGVGRRLQESPEEMQAHMQKWGVWMKGLAEKGILVDGLPLGKEGKVVTGGKKVVTDGPFAEGKEIVGGYLIVNADSLNKAVEISLGCPIYEHNGILEVREIMSMNI